MFTVGHTFTLCDSYFGGINKKSYKRNLETQQDWQDLMQTVENVTAFSVTQKEFTSWN